MVITVPMTMKMLMELGNPSPTSLPIYTLDTLELLLSISSLESVKLGCYM